MDGLEPMVQELKEESVLTAKYRQTLERFKVTDVFNDVAFCRCFYSFYLPLQNSVNRI